MSDEELVMQWFRALEREDQVAAEQFWNALSSKVQSITASKLKHYGRKTNEDEDITLSVLKSVMIRAGQGKFSWVQSYDELWALLFTIIERKVLNHVRLCDALKRGNGQVVSATDLQGNDSDSSASPLGLGNVPGKELDPQVAVLAADSIDELIKSLNDPVLVRIVELKLQGHTNEEIAEALPSSLATVERKLKMIRTIWSKQEASSVKSEP